MLELKNARALATEYMERAIVAGDRVVDATMGNGHDTAFLARLVGETGHVTAFDVQEGALINTRALLEAEGLLARVTLVHDGHERMDEYVHEPIAAAMFNLGWLPGAVDKRVTTQVSTTLEAVGKCIALLRPGGVMSVCVYPGHAEGDAERTALGELLSGLDVRRFCVLHHRFINARRDTPELFLCQKQFSAKE